jgi:hypothetical protein
VTPQQRLAHLKVLQGHYANFVDFLRDGMQLLGFSTTEIQEDIAGFMAYGPQYIMVMAQRGEAKTTIAALFCVWCLLHSPAHRVLIFSAAGGMATQVARLVGQVIMTMPALTCLRPDKQAGDRTSMLAFDIHHALKGLEKSPSVACMGIESNMQGYRADLLIADDVESTKNALTAVQRAKLLELTRDFTSINSTGRIIWLGTPQSQDTIYNTLPARGVTVRIYPGRYPTPEQLPQYGNALAPILRRRLEADPSLGTGGGPLGDQGKPTDPQLLDESRLCSKELDQGTPYFQLQHMLNTALTDALKRPLRTEQALVMPFPGSEFPLAVGPSLTLASLRDFSAGGHAFKLNAVGSASEERASLQSIWAYVDPAAGGKTSRDETAYAIGGFLNGNIFVLCWGGLPGGYDLPQLEALADVLVKYKPHGLTIEKNMGYGAFSAIFTPILRRKLASCQIEDDLVTGQKELRIINTLAPVLGRGSLVFTEHAVDHDAETLQRYSPAEQAHYSGFYQLGRLTRQRDSLPHDDRLDALEGLVRKFQADLAQDQKKRVEDQRRREWADLMKDPLGHNRYGDRDFSGRLSMLARKRR